MDLIITIIFIWFLLSLVGKMLKRFLKSETVSFLLIAFIIMCIPGWGWAGIVLVLWRYVVIPIGRIQEKHECKSSISNTTIMWLVPIFWPFLVLKYLFSGKVEKTNTTYNDMYEHERRNAK